MNLFKANRQWSTRPPDEQFTSLASLHHACETYQAVAAQSHVRHGALQTVPSGDEVALQGTNGQQALMTHWAFGQLCARAAAPASYLRDLPAPLAVECLNHGLAAQHDPNERALLMFHRNGNLLLRACTSDRYGRIWNADITRRLLALEQAGPWQPAPEAAGGSRGLYASDHDMFAFLIDNDRRVRESLPGGGLARGFFCWNSEVGAASFGVMTFLYEFICGNHVVWGAKGVRELRVRHVGNADARAFRELNVELREYADSSASDEEAQITRAMQYQLGKDKDAVLDAVFRLRVPALPRKRAEEAYVLAEQHEDWYGSPRSAWGFANGLTQLSQTIPYADERLAVDRAAGKVLEVAF